MNINGHPTSWVSKTSIDHRKRNPSGYQEPFFLMEQKVLGELFGDNEARASSWLLHDGGRNGALLREVTERYLCSFGDKPDAAARIAGELRFEAEDFREAA